MAANYSFYAIPLIWFLGMVPQGVAVGLIKRACNGKYPNANPRSASLIETLKKQMTAQDFAMMERSKAAHQNSLENYPLDVVTLIAGTAAGLSAAYLNYVAIALVLMRLLYNILYINTARNASSYTRTLIWVASRLVCVAVLLQSAGKVADRT